MLQDSAELTPTIGPLNPNRCRKAIPILILYEKCGPAFSFTQPLEQNNLIHPYVLLITLTDLETRRPP